MIQHNNFLLLRAPEYRLVSQNVKPWSVTICNWSSDWNILDYSNPMAASTTHRSACLRCAVKFHVRPEIM